VIRTLDESWVIARKKDFQTFCWSKVKVFLKSKALEQAVGSRVIYPPLSLDKDFSWGARVLRVCRQ
jgi:hypothetical protein